MRLKYIFSGGITGIYLTNLSLKLKPIYLNDNMSIFEKKVSAGFVTLSPLVLMTMPFVVGFQGINSTRFKKKEKQKKLDAFFSSFDIIAKIFVNPQFETSFNAEKGYFQGRKECDKPPHLVAKLGHPSFKLESYEEESERV